MALYNRKSSWDLSFIEEQLTRAVQAKKERIFALSSVYEPKEARKVLAPLLSLARNRLPLRSVDDKTVELLFRMYSNPTMWGRYKTTYSTRPLIIFHHVECRMEDFKVTHHTTGWTGTESFPYPPQMYTNTPVGRYPAQRVHDYLEVVEDYIEQGGL